MGTATPDIMPNGCSAFVRRFCIFLLAFCFTVTAVSVPADAYARGKKQSSRKSSKSNDRYAHIVIDAQSGFVISESNPDKKLYPASLSKMMTLYLTFEAIENGVLTKNQRIPISANAQYQPPSKLGLESGNSLRVEDGILALVTRSANDAAVVLADGIAGSESRFARLMTFKARQLGMRNTHFVNASGLHDPEQYSTARDMAILSQALMRDFPRYYRYFSTPQFVYAGITSLNHNKLMKTYKGMDGIKTGYVNASGYNLAASAVQDGHRIIGVIFGGRTSKTRNDAMEKLLDESFQRLKDPRVLASIDRRMQAARASMPKRKPITASISRYRREVNEPHYTAARTQRALEAPGFRPMGMSVEEGDTAMENRSVEMTTADLGATAPEPEPRAEFKPRPLNTKEIARPSAPLAPAAPRAAPMTPDKASKVASAVAGSWAVQVGAFTSHQAGMNALKDAHKKLPAAMTGGSTYIIAPLMTNRGIIYRARLAGLDQKQAAGACKMLKGNCLVLNLQ